MQNIEDKKFFNFTKSIDITHRYLNHLVLLTKNPIFIYSSLVFCYALYTVMLSRNVNKVLAVFKFSTVTYCIALKSNPKDLDLILLDFNGGLHFFHRQKLEKQDINDLSNRPKTKVSFDVLLAVLNRKGIS